MTILDLESIVISIYCDLYELVCHSDTFFSEEIDSTRNWHRFFSEEMHSVLDSLADDLYYSMRNLDTFFSEEMNSADKHHLYLQSQIKIFLKNIEISRASTHKVKVEVYSEKMHSALNSRADDLYCSMRNLDKFISEEMNSPDKHHLYLQSQIKIFLKNIETFRASTHKVEVNVASLNGHSTENSATTAQKKNTPPLYERLPARRYEAIKHPNCIDGNLKVDFEWFLIIYFSVLISYDRNNYYLGDDTQESQDANKVRFFRLFLYAKTNDLKMWPAKRKHLELQVTWDELKFLNNHNNFIYQEDPYEIDLTRETEAIDKDFYHIHDYINKKFYNDGGWHRSEEVNQIAKKANSGNWILCPTCHDAWESPGNQPLVYCTSCQANFCCPLYLENVDSSFDAIKAYAKTEYVKFKIIDKENIILFIPFEHLWSLFESLNIGFAYSYMDKNEKKIARKLLFQIMENIYTETRVLDKEYSTFETAFL